MKALSLWQPHASLMAHGLKLVEPRSRYTSHRGVTAIAASAAFPVEARELCCSNEPIEQALRGDIGINPERADKQLPRGVVLAVGIQYDCKPMSYRMDKHEYPDEWDPGVLAPWVGRLSTRERAFGLYSPTRFGYLWRNIVRLPEPIACKGMLGFWDVPEAVEAEILEQIGDEIVQLRDVWSIVSGRQAAGKAGKAGTAGKGGSHAAF